jgi:monofunctional biosynthetic peptidoglycan transglycosylase
LEEFFQDGRFRKFRRPKYIIGFVIIGFAFLAWFIPPVYRLVDGSVTVTQWIKRKGEVTAEVGPARTGWINSNNISKHALHAIIAAEDARFYSHIGIDPVEIWHSFRANLRRGKFARGGSTITQQVVKMAFLSREKSLIRKAREALGAILLELILPKQRILEWYINLAEFGDGVYGVKNGCWHYFRTKPAQLTVAQAVHLALVLPSPNKWSKGLRQRELTEFGHRRFTYLLNRLKNMKWITLSQWESTLASGDFGRPIAGYKKLVASAEKDTPLCPGSPDCAEDDPIWDEEVDGLEYPASEETNQSKLVPPPQETSSMETSLDQKSDEPDMDEPDMDEPDSEDPDVEEPEVDDPPMESTEPEVTPPPNPDEITEPSL